MKKTGILAPTLALFLAAAHVHAADLYDTTPAAGTPNLPSLGYEATSTAEFGGLIQLAGGPGQFALNSVTVGMSDWAYQSEWAGVGTSAGFQLPMTLNIYDVGPGNTVGALLGSVTTTQLIAWRPEPTPSTCAPGSNNDYQGSDGQCYAGSLSSVVFNTSGIATNSDELIYGLAFNTTDHGYNPTGVPAPYDSLNFALSTNPPSVGSNPLPDTAYWNTSDPGFYADGGAGGVGTFRQDTQWSPYSGDIEVDGNLLPAPEPGSLGLMVTGLLFAGILSRKRLATKTK